MAVRRPTGYHKGPVLERRDLIIFLEGKDEPYTLASGYAKWATALHRNHSVEISRCFFDNLDADDLTRTILLVIAGPRRKFSAAEFQALNTFRIQGINLLFVLGEGGEEELGTNVNTFISSFDLQFAPDCVIRRYHYKYHHPKQAIISDGLIENTPLLRNGAIGEFVYPFGCTIEVVGAAVPILTAGKCCFPTNRPIAAMSLGSANEGNVVCFGSLFAFHDQFIDCEENQQLLEAFIKVILTPTCELINGIRLPEAEDIPERPPRQIINDLHFQLTPIFEAGFEDTDLEQFCLEARSTNECEERIQLEAALIRTARKLNVSWDVNSVKIIPPLEGHLPELEFPIFEPELRLPGKPCLELFDLDEDFLTDDERLHDLAVKEPDPEKFIVAAAESLSLTDILRKKNQTPTPRNILRFLTEQLCRIGEPTMLGTEKGKCNAALHSKAEERLSTTEPRLGVSSSFQLGIHAFTAAACNNVSGDIPVSDRDILRDSLARRSRTNLVREGELSESNHQDIPKTGDLNDYVMPAHRSSASAKSLLISNYNGHQK